MKNSYTTEWEHGLAWKAIDNLEKAFINDDDVNARSLREVLRKVTMDDDQKPSEFIMDVMSVMLLNQEIRDEKKRMSSHEFI